MGGWYRGWAGRVAGAVGGHVAECWPGVDECAGRGREESVDDDGESENDVGGGGKGGREEGVRPRRCDVLCWADGCVYHRLESVGGEGGLEGIITAFCYTYSGGQGAYLNWKSENIHQGSHVQAICLGCCHIVLWNRQNGYSDNVFMGKLPKTPTY